MRWQHGESAKYKFTKVPEGAWERKRKRKFAGGNIRWDGEVRVVVGKEGVGGKIGKEGSWK